MVIDIIQKLSNDFNKKVLSPRIIFGNAELLNIQDYESPFFIDHENLPFYYYLGKYFPVNSFLSIGFGLGLATSAYLLSCRPKLILGQHDPDGEFYSSRIGKGNVLRIAKKKINVRIGSIQSVLSNSMKWNGIIFETQNKKNIYEDLEFCSKICDGWICVDKAKNKEIKETVKKFCKVYDKKGHFIKSRYGFYLIEI